MCAPGISGRIRVQGQRAHLRSIERQSLVFSSDVRLGRGRLFTDHHSMAQRKRAGAFTLLELLIVISIIALLLVLMGPAFTSLKSGTDVTSAAYTIKGVLDTARTYAQANNTYTWVGFFEEDISNPPNPGTGRLVISIVASKDGTNVYGSGTVVIDPTKLLQVGKLIKIDNIHVPLFALGTGMGDTFDARPSPSPATDANYSRFGELNGLPPNTAPLTTPHSFQYPVGNPAPTAQYTFSKLLQFNPRGDSRVSGDSYDVRQVVEIGLLQTHGSATPPPRSGGGTSFVTWDGNVAAVQITGFGGSVKIYRR
jgi:prepilin-type N-terminal cleavage/methylation domain-containing protein